MTDPRLAELLGRLSLAFDIANDSPHGKAVRSTVLAVELGARAGASEDELRDTLWVSLLAYLGCTGFAHDEGLMGGGDDRAVRSAMSMASPDEPLGSALGVLRRLAPDESLVRRARLLVGIFTDRTVMGRFQRAMCDASIRLAQIVGTGPSVIAGLDQLCERWDGKGVPGAVRGEALSLPMRLQQIGHVAEIAHHRGGRPAALEVVRRRAKRQFDPRLADVFVKEHGALFESIEDPQIFERFLRLEPKPVATADHRRIDDLARALAIFADLKSPTFLVHSTGVAALAERAAGELGLDADETRSLRWAALLHDLGRLSVPNGIWTKPGPLDWGAKEHVRLHSYYTGRVLDPIGTLADVARIAAAAHERLDASGYPERRSAQALPLTARVLAAADAAFAMSEDRPYRPALSSDAIARELLADAGSGRLDAKAVDAVLASLGRAERVPAAATHGLSERELDVSRLLARGQSNKAIGTALRISPRTVQVHVARIFEKLGVRSRAGAAIWLIEHGLAR
ncbi:MAG TPA: HD domain-containing phosphohydrolase [Polyangiaceae bacterium]